MNLSGLKKPELVEQARELVDQSNWSEALAYWQACVTRFGTGKEPWWDANIARCLIELGREEEADRVIGEIRSAFPGYPASYTLAATLDFRAGRYARAAKRWQYCINQFHQAQRPSWFMSLATAQQKMGHGDAQETTLGSMIMRFPHQSEGFVALSDLHTRNKQWDKARFGWETCMRLFPEQACKRWRIQLTHSIANTSRYQKALGAYEELLKNYPEDIKVLGSFASFYASNGYTEEAEALWIQCSELAPNDVQWRLQQVRHLVRSRKYGQLYDVLEHCLENLQADAGECAVLAANAMTARHWHMAKQAWEKCIELAGDHIQNNWIERYALTLCNLDEHAAALSIYQALESEGFEGIELHSGKSRALFGLEKYQKCIETSRTAQLLHPDSKAGFFWEEESLIRMGRYQEAARVHVKWASLSSPAKRKDVRPPNIPEALVLPEPVGISNDYSFIEEKVKNRGTGKFTLKVSVIVPVYNRTEMLGKTLAGLVNQTYPSNLFEIIIADDGSSDAPEQWIELFESKLDIRIVCQEDLGYRLSRVRNLAISEASYDYIIMLDCDVVPVPGYIESFMRFFHVTSDAVLFGLRYFVNIEDIGYEDILENPELYHTFQGQASSAVDKIMQDEQGNYIDWRYSAMIRYDNFKTHLFEFQAFSGCSQAFPTAALDRCGRYDEEFTDWGGEDIEFGYRLYNAGYYFIPVAGALGYHQETVRNQQNYQVDRKAGKSRSDILLMEKCPAPYYRSYEPGRQYSVPKVSIYIPAYNAEKYLADSIESALLQTFQDLEVVVCDDGSTDSTLEILQSCYSENPQVRWITQNHQGIGAASNTAVHACRGMYVGQLDSDDLLHPRAVETMVAILDRENYGYIYGISEIIGDDESIPQSSAAEDFSRYTLMASMVCSHFRFFRKRDWMRTGGFNTRLTNAVDYDMALKFSEVCNIRAVPVLTYYYRFHGANTSIMHRDTQRENHVRALNEALQRMGLQSDWLVVRNQSTTHGVARYIDIRDNHYPSEADDLDIHP